MRNRIFAKLLLVVSVSLFFLSQSLYAQQSDNEESTPEQLSRLQKVIDSGKLRVGVNPEFKPFSFVGDSGERTGVDLEIGKQLAEALGVEFEAVAPESFSDLIPMLLEDKVDVLIAGMSVTFERAKQVNFSDPYFDTGMSVLMNIGNSARLGIGGIRESSQLLKKLRSSGTEKQPTIAVTEGKAPAEEAKRQLPEAAIKTYPTNEEAAEATLAGEADLMIHDEIFLKVWLEANASRAGFKMVVLDPPIKPDFYGIATQKGDLEWLQLLNVFVQELRANTQVIGYLAEFLPTMNTDQMVENSMLSLDSLGEE